MDIDSSSPNHIFTKQKSENIVHTNNNKNLNSLGNRSIINMKSHDAIGLDLDEFTDGSNFNNDMVIDTPQEIQINDFDIINEIAEQQQTFNGVINKRIKSLKMLLKFWSDDISNAVNSLGM